MSAILPGDVPADAGIFVADRSAPGVRPNVLYWRSGCLVAQLTASRTRLCNPRAATVFIARTAPVFHTRTGLVHDTFLIGVVRSDVTRVTVQSPGATQTVLDGSKRKTEPLPPQGGLHRADARLVGELGGQHVPEPRHVERDRQGVRQARAHRDHPRRVHEAR